MAIDYDHDVARDIYAVGQRMGVSDDVMLAGISAALVESNMSNVDYGDRDSLGVFQQRPSQGWGTEQQVMRPRYAARQFFQAAEGVDDYANVGDLAQQVQRSAYPDRYQQRLDDARRILARLRGGDAGQPTQVQAAGGGFTPVEDEDHSPLLMAVLQSISQHMRGAPDPDETPEQATVRQATGGAAGQPVTDDPAARAEAGATVEGGLDSEGDTDTGTRARSDPNAGAGPLAWGGFANGRIPIAELVKVHSAGATHYLAPDAARAFRSARAAAKRDGVTLTITDSYRDYDAQVATAKEKGLYGNGGLAAVPGTSPHGWGKAIDIAQGQEWMAENGSRFGFSTLDREPWHWQLGG